MTPLTWFLNWLWFFLGCFITVLCIVICIKSSKKGKNMSYTLKTFRVVEELPDAFCGNSRCHAVHYICPFCGNQSSVTAEALPEYFSSTCAETGEHFLVHFTADEESNHVN